MDAVACDDAPVLLQRPEREVPMTDFVDTRVDVCLYFIAPHALLPADIATIKRLGRLVPIVPIIAKVHLPPARDEFMCPRSRPTDSACVAHMHMRMLYGDGISAVAYSCKVHKLPLKQALMYPEQSMRAILAAGSRW